MVGRTLATCLLGGAGAVYAHVLASLTGQTSTLAGWDLQSTSSISKDLASLSKPGLDVSKWHHTSASRCTIMGCLIDAGVYKDSDIWFSDNLNHFNWGQFTVPWAYRTEFALQPKSGNHFLLQTNGITSKADLFLNGKQIADKEYQAGAFGGRTYDITGVATNKNALLVQVYPTDYNYDFAIGFVDWNPYPPDNGTGVWRDITIKQTGPVASGPLTVSTDISGSDIESSPAKITVHARAENLESKAVDVDVEVVITEPNTGKQTKLSKKVRLGSRETKTIPLTHTFTSPQIWWPKQWGAQPVYKAAVSLSVGNEISDSASATFGIRTVTSAVNAYNDTMFTVNGRPFQVLGGGYGADMFLRWDSARFTSIARYALDMGLNTIRLEGMLEQPELYEIATELGLMILGGWQCCDKWESWSYNDQLSVSPVPVFNANDYQTINASILHEAAMMQTHPSMLAFLIGSDFWPNEEATSIYVSGLESYNWEVPIIASAAKAGFPKSLGIGGMDMDGPYDWAPPNLWYDTDPWQDRAGAAFGFGSEFGAGVGTPEIGSLKKFLSASDLKNLWTKKKAPLFHMSTNVSSFPDRGIYNGGLYSRYGRPTSLEDYILKSQIMDYEATRAQFEAYSSRWNAAHPATGAIYWMLNSAWPSLHWNLFDYYLHPAGAYFGTKVGSRLEHVSYDYIGKDVWLINHSLTCSGARSIAIEVIDLHGKVLSTQKVDVMTTPNKSFKAADVKGLDKFNNVVFLRLILTNNKGSVLSRNVYWIAKTIDTIDWANSTWYYTPVSKYADYNALSRLQHAILSVKASTTSSTASATHQVVLENKSSVPAFFIRLNLVDARGEDVNPVLWSENYVTLWPHEKLTLDLSDNGSGKAVQISGKNVKAQTIRL